MTKKMLFTVAALLVSIGMNGLFCRAAATDVSADFVTVVDVGTAGAVKSPSIYENKIVWQDNSRNSAHDYWEIYMYDLTTMDEEQIDEYPANLSQDAWHPVIYGDIVVFKKSIFLKDYGPMSAITMYNMHRLGEKTSRIDVFTSLGNSKPDIYKYNDESIRVILEVYSKSDYSIDANPEDTEDSYIYCCHFGESLPNYGYTFSNVTEISAGSNYNRNPAIYGNTIVWERARVYSSSDPNYTNIAIYNISEGTITKSIKVSMGKDGAQLDIYEDKIVWQDNRNGSWDIYMYDIAASKETIVCCAAGDQTLPVISKNTVVWQDNRNGSWDIYMYDLSTGQELCLSDGQTDETEPAIYENKIVWVDGGAKICAAILLPDTDKPIIAHAPISSVKKTRPIIFKAKVTDNTSDIKSVTLHWREYLGSNKWTKICSKSMKLIENDDYKTVIGTRRVVQYCIKSKDKAGNKCQTPVWTINRY